MKKYLFLLSLFLFSSCACVLSQIPPQRIYAGATCSAVLPDYRLRITATDNCEIASLTQTPLPGYSLGPTNKTTTVTVKATDATGNFRQVVFTVTLLDTIKPVLTIDATLLTYQTEQINEIYNFGDKLVAYTCENLLQQTWIDGYVGLREKLNDSAYYKKNLVVMSHPNPDGSRGRFISFADSIGLYSKLK